MWKCSKSLSELRGWVLLSYFKTKHLSDRSYFIGDGGVGPTKGPSVSIFHFIADGVLQCSLFHTEFCSAFTSAQTEALEIREHITKTDNLKVLHQAGIKKNSDGNGLSFMWFSQIVMLIYLDKFYLSQHRSLKLPQVFSTRLQFFFSF